MIYFGLEHCVKQGKHNLTGFSKYHSKNRQTLGAKEGRVMVGLVLLAAVASESGALVPSSALHVLQCTHDDTRHRCGMACCLC